MVMLKMHLPVWYAMANAKDATTTRSKVQYYTPVPKNLLHLVQPNRALFRADADHKKQTVFWWISSNGPHPRSGGSGSATNDEQYVRDFRLAQPYVIDVAPGDVLYIPPYTWHTVETTETSVSMATLSNENIIRNELEHVYSTNHKFDLLMHPAGKVAAFRMYIDLIVHKLYGNDPLETPKFVASLLRERYGGNVDSLFDLGSTGDIPTPVPDYMRCRFAQYLDDDEMTDNTTLTIPTSQEVYQHSAVDTNMIGAAFLEIADSEVRDLLFADYFEEVALEVATPVHYATMLTHCFAKRAHFTVTSSATDIHNDLWRHYDEEIDGARD